MKTVIAVYDDFSKAAQVVDALEKSGFDRADISVLANDSQGRYASSLRGSEAGDGDVEAGEGAAFGALTGALTGLLIGMGALTIPGIGPVIAAGPIISALAGAGVGAVTGGIVAALVDLGVTNEDANLYAEGIRRGGTLVAVKARDDSAETAAAIMQSGEPVDLDASASHWRAEGWQRYMEQDQPYPAQHRTEDLLTTEQRNADVIRVYGYDIPPQ